MKNFIRNQYSITKKHILVAGLFLYSTYSYAQIGINTTNPKSTLDVRVKRDKNGLITDNSQIFGLQPPRITRAELTVNLATYNNDQSGAIIYVTDVSGGNTLGNRTNITTIGYYYFDGSLWQKLNAASGEAQNIDAENGLKKSDTGNIKLGGTLLEDTDISTAGKKLTITGSGFVGIGTASPASTLDVGNQFKFITSSQSGNNSGDALFQIGSTAAGRWSRITGSSTTSSLAFWGDNLGNVAGNSNPHLVISGAAATKGNIGIGVGSEAPTAKLHIKTNTGGSGFKLVDGTQGTDKVLTSNADGNASWQSASAFIPSAKPTVTGTLRTADGNQIARSYTSVLDTRITLSAGRWLVYIGQMITSSLPSSQENNGWVRFTLSENYDPNNATSGNLVKTNFTMPTATGNGFALVSANTSSMNSGAYYSFASGVILVEVTPPAGATSVTLSLNFESNLYRGTITDANTFVSNNRENYFFAVPIN